MEHNQRSDQTGERDRTEADWAKEARFWKQAAASHLCLTTTFNRPHHKRIPGHTMSDHLAALRRYHSAVADRL